MSSINVSGNSILFSEGTIGPVKVRNRLVMAAMGNALANRDGSVSDAMIRYYEERARGGVGMIIIQCASISTDAIIPGSLCIHNDSYIDGLKSLVAMAHEYGTKVAIQLMHPGMLLLLLRSIPGDMPVKIPSHTSRTTDDRPYEVVTVEDIEHYIQDFSVAALRVRETGADAVELHACHGCLVSSFLSPATNHRTDLYGGNVENRTRFASEIIRAMRQAVGEFPLLVRINGSDDLPDGLTPDEAIKQAQLLEASGADAISVSAGIEYYSTLMAPPYMTPNRVNCELSAAIKKSVSVPVLVAGKIPPEEAESVLADNQADFIAMGRPFLSDPEFPAKLQEGKNDSIRNCVCCNNCINMQWRSCTVNPGLFRESSEIPPKSGTGKTILIAGGGPAGMEAAVLLAQRGHRVSLYEKRDELGGQWKLASRVPGKQQYASFIDYMQRQMAEQGVKVSLNQAADRAIIDEVKPDAVIVATGAKTTPLSLPMSENAKVADVFDVLSGKVQIKGTAAVIGARLIAVDTALYLAKQGIKVSLVSHGELGGKRGADEKSTFRALTRELLQMRIPLYLNVELLEIGAGFLLVRMRDELLELPADIVIPAIGVDSNDALSEQLKDSGIEVYVIGDAMQPGNAARATYSASRVLRYF